MLSQTVQEPPARPQYGKASVLQAPFEQQPPEHELASHVQAPETHSVPPAQGAQAAPPVPHMGVVGDSHVEPLQHPVGQVSSRHAGHTPPLQWPGAQSSHEPPPDPHAPSALPGWHVLPEQHPVGHEAASQTHTPPWHS